MRAILGIMISCTVLLSGSPLYAQKQEHAEDAFLLVHRLDHPPQEPEVSEPSPPDAVMYIQSEQQALSPGELADLTQYMRAPGMILGERPERNAGDNHICSAEE